MISVLRGILTWAALLLFLAVVLEWSGGATPLGFLAVITLAVATFALSAWRARKGLAVIQVHLARGDPDRLIAAVDARLRYRVRPEARGPLLIFRAAGLAMQGHFDQALAELDKVDLDKLPDPGAAIWRFGYYGARFGALLFSERVEEARAVFLGDIVPLTRSGELRGAEEAIAAAQAELDFCDGKLEDAARVFGRLVRDARIPPSSRCVFHYFLGRIASEEGREADAERHFRQATDLGPKTWVPDGIRALYGATYFRVPKSPTN